MTSVSFGRLVSMFARPDSSDSDEGDDEGAGGEDMDEDEEGSAGSGGEVMDEEYANDEAGGDGDVEDEG